MTLRDRIVEVLRDNPEVRAIGPLADAIMAEVGNIEQQRDEALKLSKETIAANLETSFEIADALSEADAIAATAKAESARLRQALKRLADLAEAMGLAANLGMCDDAIIAARAALADQKGGAA